MPAVWKHQYGIFANGHLHVIRSLQDLGERKCGNHQFHGITKKGWMSPFTGVTGHRTMGLSRCMTSIGLNQSSCSFGRIPTNEWKDRKIYISAEGCWLICFCLLTAVILFVPPSCSLCLEWDAKFRFELCRPAGSFRPCKTISMKISKRHRDFQIGGVAACICTR